MKEIARFILFAALTYVT